MNIEKNLLKEFAKEIAVRIAKKTIYALQKIKITQSGDDSGLKNAWDEICVQIQDDESSFWSAYEETVQSWVFGYIEELRSHEKLVIWLQTEQGWDWAYDNEEQSDGYPAILVEDIVEFVTQEYIYSKAACWSNNRIKNYMERISDTDDYW